MTDHEKTIHYYKTAAMQQRHPMPMPDWVPARVMIKRRVHGDCFFADSFVLPGEYDCKCNLLGAVSVIATNGKMLGLRLDEFEPIAWRENVQPEKVP